MPNRIFGHIPGYPEGSRFESRAELSEAGVHRPLVAGISGSEREGADSIVLSGGYEDDKDLGDEVVYTGHGGRDAESGKQVAHQRLTRGNLALAHSGIEGLPVRVVRGASIDSIYAPRSGYRYDGLYMVESYWQAEGKSGFRVWRYRLLKLPSIPTRLDVALEASAAHATPERRETTVLRLVRDTAQARRIKELYDYRCQMCGTRLEGLAGPYAEAAHIRPLGAPHNGPDSPDNILCLCPNHHVLFDHGGVGIGEDLSLIGAEAQLQVHPRHRISDEHLQHRREHYLDWSSKRGSAYHSSGSPGAPSWQLGHRLGSWGIDAGGRRSRWPRTRGHSACSTGRTPRGPRAGDVALPKDIPDRVKGWVKEAKVWEREELVGWLSVAMHTRGRDDAPIKAVLRD
jgi:putative restriction endonuclease